MCPKDCVLLCYTEVSIYYDIISLRKANTNDELIMQSRRPIVLTTVMFKRVKHYEARRF